MTQSKNIWYSLLILAAIIIVVGLYWTRRSQTTIQNQPAASQSEKPLAFTGLSSRQLSDLLPNKDFTLIDVHIPEQVHVPGTDFMIPYNDLTALIKVLPDKQAKIVLYCRSGSMSKTAAQALVDQGYANIFDLTNGMNEWLSEGRATIPLGSIPEI